MRSATFLSIVDGDTFRARIDLAPSLSLRILTEAKVRVHGWNAAELSETEGPRMRDEFGMELKSATRIRLRLGRMSYDRIVCDVYLDDVPFLGVLVTRLRQLRTGEIS